MVFLLVNVIHGDILDLSTIRYLGIDEILNITEEIFAELKCKIDQVMFFFEFSNFCHSYLVFIQTKPRHIFSINFRCLWQVRLV